MELLPGQEFELPPNLQTLHVVTQTVISNAHIYQAEINASTASPSAKNDLIRKAVAALDKQSEACFMGKEVQIEGNYSYPEVTINEDDFAIKAISEYGIRRGLSLGFYAKLLPVHDADGEIRKDQVTAELSHGVVMGDMSFGNRLFFTNGRANINAPISKSSLVPCEIEDYRNKMFAEMFVRLTKRDSRWTDSIDETLYCPEGPDFQTLGKRLSKLRDLRSDRIEDYLTYVNLKLGIGSSSAEIMCDKVLVYSPGIQTPYMVNRLEIVQGRNPDISFADSFKHKVNSQTAVKVPKTIPTLSLRSIIPGQEGEHVVHIPLSGIQCAEFK